MARDLSIEQALSLAKKEIKRGNINVAIRLFKAVLDQQPSHPVAKKGLRKLQDKHAQGQADNSGPGVEQINYLKHLYYSAIPDKTEQACRELLRAYPNSVDIYNIFGACLINDHSRLAEAIKAFDKAVEIQPNFAAAYYNRGDALKQIGRLDDALDSYDKAIRLEPNNAFSYNNRGLVLQYLGKPSEAISSYEHAAQIKPDYADAFCNLGLAYQECGLLGQARDAFLNAVRLNPDSALAFSNYLYLLNYFPEMKQADIFIEHRRFEKEFINGPIENVRPLCSDDTGRLKVGYVSSDFKLHSVAYFFEPLISAHDKGQVEIYCYYNGNKTDDMTRRLMGVADCWRSIYGCSDDAVVSMVKSDGIDILVDLNGHTAGNRLTVFGRKPAPVQISWLGYPNTTGMSAIDFRFTDDIADPVGDADALHSEKLLRLRGGFLCYRGVNDIDIAPAPCIANGYVSFGSFNNLTKVTPEVVGLWAEILRSIPEARLVLKANQLADEMIRGRYLDLFEDEGVAAGRIKMYSRTATTREHLGLYRTIDIALDPFPYNGTTTTCEALWMGVPVITMVGQRHSSRVGASILTHAGLDDFIAATPAEYAALAQRLAADMNALARQRGELRTRFRQSAVCDADRFARTMENAYKEIWRRCGDTSKLDSA